MLASRRQLSPRGVRGGASACLRWITRTAPWRAGGVGAIRGAAARTRHRTGGTGPRPSPVGSRARRRRCGRSRGPAEASPLPPGAPRCGIGVRPGAAGRTPPGPGRHAGARAQGMIARGGVWGAGRHRSAAGGRCRERPPGRRLPARGAGGRGRCGGRRTPAAGPFHRNRVATAAARVRTDGRHEAEPKKGSR